MGYCLYPCSLNETSFVVLFVVVHSFLFSKHKFVRCRLSLVGPDSAFVLSHQFPGHSTPMNDDKMLQHVNGRLNTTINCYIAVPANVVVRLISSSNVLHDMVYAIFSCFTRGAIIACFVSLCRFWDC